MRVGWFVVVLFVTTTSAEEQPWWRTATFYEIYPRSFKDTDGDGIGDLKGIIQNVDYFKDIGVDALWLSPINIIPAVDFGYETSNYTEVDSILGTLDDFEELLAKLKQVGVKLLMDFDPNHSSDQHPWFQASADPSHPLHKDYRDFYVWMDPKGTTSEGQPVPPNNWMSVAGGSAWTWSEQRSQFYLHQFLPQQPDLNFRNPQVLGNVTEIMSFWLANGVDGFRLDVAPHLVEDSNFLDEPAIAGTSGDTWFTLNHTYTKHQPETFQIMSYWSDIMYKWNQKDHSERVLLVEVYADASTSKKYYGTGRNSFQVPFNFMLMTKGIALSKPSDFKEIIDQWMAIVPLSGVASWVVGDHYLSRVSDRYGPDMVDAVCILTGVLPGVKVVYFGEEIGMESTPLTWEQIVDPWTKRRGPEHYHGWTRDFVRTPMQWDNTTSAGFSTNSSTWLPVNPNYLWLNVEAQRAAPASHLKVFQAMAKVRKDPVLQRGDLKVLVPDDDTLLIVRSLVSQYFILIINLGNVSRMYTSRNLFDHHGLDMDMKIVVASEHSGYEPGIAFRKRSMDLTLKSKAAILLRSESDLRTSSSDSHPFTSRVFAIFVLFIILGI